MPTEKPESNSLTRTGNRLLFGGAGVALGTTVMAISGGPDGVIAGAVGIAGGISAAVGAVLMTVGNKSKVDPEKIIAEMKKKGPKIPASTYGDESW